MLKVLNLNLFYSKWPLLHRTFINSKIIAIKIEVYPYFKGVCRVSNFNVEYTPLNSTVNILTKTNP